MLCHFQVYSKVIQFYIYMIYVYNIHILFQIIFHYIITRYWIQLLVLDSRSLLFICFIYSSVFMLTPSSQLCPN